MTLFRYIANEYIRIFTICVSGFVGLALVVDLFEKAGTFLKYDAGALTTVRYAMFRAPEFITWTIPASVMMATLLTLVTLSRRNEIVAMLAGGIGRRTAALPILTVAMLLSGIHFGIAEYVVPRANEAARNVMVIEVKKQAASRLHQRTGHWFYAGGAFLRVGVTDDVGLQDVLILKPGSANEAPERIESADARWNGTAWVLSEGRRITQSEDGRIMVEPAPAGTVLKLGLEPQDLRTDVRHTDEWAFHELRRVIQDRERLGQDVRRQVVDLYGKIAFPFASLVMCLVALPFGFRTARSGGAALGIVVGLALGFAYFVVMTFGLSVGRSGALHPLLAAWLPNMLFGGVGTYLAITLDRL